MDSGSGVGVLQQKIEEVILVCLFSERSSNKKSFFFLSILGEGGIELSFLFGGNSEDDQLEISN